MKAYPTWFYISLLVSLFALIISGILLVPTTLDLRFEWDVIWRLTGDHRLKTVATHTGLSYFILVMVGALAPVHMRAGLKSKRNLLSGLSLIILFLLLILTGTGLFYFGDENWIAFASVLHIIAGIALLGVFTNHFIFKPKSE